MKLATLNVSQKNRDGELHVVSKNLKWAVNVSQTVPNLQSLLENWQEYSQQLQTIYNQLNDKQIDTAFELNLNMCHSPLPRAFQWADGSAYVNHVELVRKARGAEMPEDFWHQPLMYQGGSDSFIGPYEDIVVSDESYGIDFEAEVAVVTDDVPMNINAENAVKHIKLIMLVNDVSLRNLIPNEIKKGFGFFQSKPASSFSPIAITPDELGTNWQDTMVHLPLYSYLNDDLVGKPNAGVDMTFSFSQLIAHAAKTRKLTAGSIIGSGTVSNLDRSLGSSCLAEKRMLELLETGEIKTPFMAFGDNIRIEMLDSHKQNIFGSIVQTVRRANS